MSRRWTPYLTLADLAAGVERWKGRYEAVDVFADDVAEMNDPVPLADLPQVGDKPPRFEFEHDGRQYHVVLYEDAGVLRLEKPRADLATGAVRTGLAGAASAGIGTIVAKSVEQKGSAAKLGILLGLFAGAFSDSSAASRPQRVYAMEFEPYRREWIYYEGGLRNWLSRKLLPS